MSHLYRWSLVVGVTLSVLLIGCSDQTPQVVGPQQQQYFSSNAPLLNKVAGAKYIDSAYIVVFLDDIKDVDSEVRQMGESYGIKANHSYKHTLKGFAGKLSQGQRDALAKDKRVAYIEQDQIATMDAVQTSPPSWGLDRIDQRTLPLSASYSYDQTGVGVDAYCLDTGIRTTHTDFGGRAIAGYDAITPGGSASDGNGHGTHTAGTIGGTSYGVAKGVRLIAVKVLADNGSGSYSQVIAGVDWATGHHTTTPAVANMSLGGSVSASLDYAVRRSIADGITYCVSAGNSRTDASTQSPAGVTEAITVGATDRSDVFASFSNYGSVVDIHAPGVSITSAYYTSDLATATYSGTSMSAPHVAGAAALYLQANPTATPADVQTALTANASVGVITGVPAGTVNKLLYSIGGQPPPPPPPPPAAPSLISPANGATNVAVPATLSWSSSSTATSYRVQVSTKSDFLSPVYDQSVTSTSTSVSGLAGSTLYYWRVSASNSGGTSTPSLVFSFTTAAPPPPPPPAPTLISPADGANNMPASITFQWNASTGASSYRLQISTSPNFTKLAYDKSGLTLTSATVSGLAGKSRFYWRINATGTTGTSAWSTVWNFRTARY